MPDRPSEDFTIRGPDGVGLSGAEAGEGPPIVLLHGLTATRRYVVMGSRLLERSGHRVIAYDARGHGRSEPAPNPSAYTYELLAADLLAVLDGIGVERGVLAGASMGAQTALRVALAHPERVSALALITPAFDPDTGPGKISDAGTDEFFAAGTEEISGTTVGAQAYAGWDALARGLREGGVEGFIAAYDVDAVPERWHGTVTTVLRQRLSAHEHPNALADALQAVPRSRPFETWRELARISAPTLVVGSRDEADPGHPLAVAERYAEAIPGARLTVEQAGSSPIAWQGGELSRSIVGLVDERAGR